MNNHILTVKSIQNSQVPNLFLTILNVLCKMCYVLLGSRFSVEQFEPLEPFEPVEQFEPVEPFEQFEQFELLEQFEPVEPFEQFEPLEQFELRNQKD